MVNLPNIHIIEDSRSRRCILENLLREKGRIVAYENGVDFSNRINGVLMAAPPVDNVFICDFSMPNGNARDTVYPALDALFRCGNLSASNVLFVGMSGDSPDPHLAVIEDEKRVNGWWNILRSLTLNKADFANFDDMLLKSVDEFISREN